MFQNLAVPFTIVKEKNDNASVNDHNQYKWEKTLLSSEQLNYVIEDISLVQEPTETLNLSVSLLQVESKCKVECNIGCYSCRVKITGKKYPDYCAFCRDDDSRPIEVTCNCPNDGGNIIVCDIKMNFHNYVHEFTGNYYYEVSCKIPCEGKPDEYLFLHSGIRSEKTIIFKKYYASTAYGEKFNMSSLNLYFGIRRVVNQNSEMSIPTMPSIVSIFQNTDFDDQKVILHAKDGRVTAYKSVLSHYSEVFRAMLAHEMKEKQEGVVKISDFDCNVVKKMVNYLYTGNLGNITEMVQELFKLAHQYQLHELCRRCEEYYMFNFSIDNHHIVDILELADLYDLKELKNSAEKFVKRYEKDLCELPSYQTYLCQTITVQKAVETLILADKYKVDKVKANALDFIKLNYNKMIKSDDFLNLFDSNSRLMKEIYVHFSEENH